MNQINDRIRELRSSHKLTVAKMAESIGVSPGNLSDWESNKKKSTPTAKALIAISQKFNVSLDWLMKGETPLYITPPYSHRLLQTLEDLTKQLSEEDLLLIHNVALHLVSKNQSSPYLLATDKEAIKISQQANIVKETSFATEYFVKLPLVGKITAGAPILALENIDDFINVPKHMAGSGNHFLLRVQGESMIDKDILDGDMVVIRQQQDAENGEVVVALIDNEEATLKCLFKEYNRVRLQPANHRYNPIFPNNVKIIGKVVGILRTAE